MALPEMLPLLENDYAFPLRVKSDRDPEYNTSLLLFVLYPSLVSNFS